MLQRLLNRFGYVHKSQMQHAKRHTGFPAAGAGRLLGDFPTSNLSIDSILRRELIRLRPRARHLYMRDPYFVKYISLLQTNINGCEGIQLKNKAVNRNGDLDARDNKKIEDAWYEWGQMENCTMSKEYSWFDVQNLSTATIGTDGEMLFRFVRGPQAQNKFNFAIQMIESDMLDIEKNETTANGEIRMGVEKDAWGRRTGYWLHGSNPSDTFSPFPFNTRWLRLPANEVIHPFLPRRIGQTRGFPWAAAAMVRMHMVGGYEENEEVRSRVAAGKMLFFKRQPGAEYTAAIEGDQKIMDVEPGLCEELDPGLEPVAIDWNSPAGNFDPFVKASLRGIAAGLLVSYPTLANDYASVNFSSGRMAQLEEREVWKALQTWTATHIHNRIFNAWLEMALMSGAIGNLPLEDIEKFRKPTFHGRRWTWVDPVAEVEAAIEEINSGLTSWERKVTELGYDADELLAEILQSQNKLSTLPIPLPLIYQKLIEKAQAKKQAAPKAA